MAPFNPFLLIPWQKPFLPALKSLIMEQTEGKPGTTLIITPNKRPWRYLVDLFRKEGKAIALPKMMPVAEMTALWRGLAHGMPSYLPNIIEQTFALKKCMARVGKTDPLIASHLAHMNYDEYLPWGIRLAQLLEEMFLQGVPIRDIPYASDDVAEPAAHILSALGRIGEEWRRELSMRGWSTEGFDNYLASRHLDKIPEPLRPGPDRPVYIAGFSTLNGVQDKLFYKLWEAGARVCLHGNAAAPDGASRHDPCKPLHDWAKRWYASIHPLAEQPETLQAKPSYHFFAAYDEHSQLKQMAADLPAYPSGSGSVAIILPNEDLLMPVLHELPCKKVNISMGYPLGRVTLVSMLEQLFRPRRKIASPEIIYWQEALGLLKLPFFGMLTTLDENGRRLNLKEPLRDLTARIRTGGPNADMGSLVEQVCENLPQAQAELLRKSYQVFLYAPASSKTFTDMAEALDGIVKMLMEYGADIFASHPLDAEALARLMEGVIPVLRHTPVPTMIWQPSSLYKILRLLFVEERIPFEADPLLGMQILGMLETRLLNFDHLFILDASDDSLPGRRPQDPLLPDSLRQHLGLPNAAARHAVVGYNLFRLCAGARDVHFYWAEGNPSTSGGTGKQYRSRFVEQIIWQLESEEYKRILEPGEGDLKIAVSSAMLSPGQTPVIRRDEKLDQAMQAILEGQLSASLLNTYLACPLRFMLSHLLHLQPGQEVREGDMPDLVGDCLHKALEKFFNAHKGMVIRDLSVETEALLQTWQTQYRESGLDRRLPPASSIALECAAPIRLREFAKNFPQGTEVIACEQKIMPAIVVDGQKRHFYARLDRLDKREDGYHIVDYKTGRLPEVKAKVWEDNSLFSTLEAYMADHEKFDSEADNLLEELREKIVDLQLPLYMLAGEAALGVAPANAAWVELRDKGEEKPLLPDGADKEKAMANFRILLRFILRHMGESSQFTPCEEGKSCEWCDYKSCCHRG